ncbi:MAG: PD-(D/E)XK nuclease family transposase, partial [Bacteroidota bacterium]
MNSNQSDTPQPTRYINALVDFSFRKIFGSDPNKDMLIAFLNEIFKGRKHIVDLVYNKNEHDGENKGEARAVFDLLCTGDQGERFIIEVQHTKPVNFKKRGIYYTSRLISEQAIKGQVKNWQYDISEVYFVAVLEQQSDLNPSSDRYIHDACLCYRDTGEIFYEGLGYTYLDLHNFVKTEEECVSEMELWLYWLKHLHETDKLPEHLKETIFERLF